MSTRHLLNTLYVATQGAALHLDHDTVRVRAEGRTLLRVPLHHLGSLVLFGRVSPSIRLMHACGERGICLVLLDEGGRFRARVSGPLSGNVLLRRAQHEASACPDRATALARHLVAGKVQNARASVLRSVRDTHDGDDARALRGTADALEGTLRRLPSAADADTLRGMEGEAARVYFSTLDRMVVQGREHFRMEGRSRRPPRDRINALLSFLYTLLTADCVAAAEGVGLDPQVGFLHALRPGRPALALDLMEELRPVLADRLALTLVNRKQVGPDGFVVREGGAVHLADEARRRVIAAYQERKKAEVAHPILGEKVPLGLVPHLQARLLARTLRGELEGYPPFLHAS